MPPKTTAFPKNAAIDVRRTLRDLDALGLPDAAPEARRLAALAEHYSTTASTAVGNDRRTRDDLARALLEGTTDLDAASTELVDAAHTIARRTAAVDLARAVSDMAWLRAARALADLGDDLIADLWSIAGPALNAAGTVATKVLGVVADDAQAVRADKPVRDAWATLTTTAELWQRTCRVAADLRDAGVLPVPAPADQHLNRADLPLWSYRHPELLTPRGDQRRPLPPALRLAQDLAAGADPHLWTGAELAEHLAAIDAERRAEAERRRAAARQHGRSSHDDRRIARAVAAEVVAELRSSDRDATHQSVEPLDAA